MAGRRFARGGYSDEKVRRLVVEAGGSVEEKHAQGTVGFAQFGYKRKAKKADREALVLALTRVDHGQLAVAA